MKKQIIAVLSALFIVSPFQAAMADVVTVVPSSQILNNCFPFANATAWGPYMGFVYKDIPAFALEPGDELAFDTGVYRPGPEVQLAIHMVETTSNGSIENAGPLTQIVSNTHTPTNPNGDDILDNFEMVFTVDNNFTFGGGGLIIAFSDPSVSYQAAAGCEQVLVNGSNDDPSGFFVWRFRQDADGIFPYDDADGISIGGFQVRTGDDAGGEGEASTIARFNVTKTFSNGATNEVDVALSCNGGLPLEQSFTIAGGDPDGVSFVVTDFAPGTTCEVTETAGPDGFTPSYNDGAGCTFTDITATTHTCAITNEAEPVEFTVDVGWMFNDAADADLADSAMVEIWCENISTTTVDASPDSDALPYVLDVVPDDTCYAMLSGVGSAISSESECYPIGIDVDAGSSGESCTISAGVFFEGIPTLSQYGMALMALLMLGLGFVGFRRFV